MSNWRAHTPHGQSCGSWGNTTASCPLLGSGQQRSLDSESSSMKWSACFLQVCVGAPLVVWCGPQLWHWLTAPRSVSFVEGGSGLAECSFFALTTGCWGLASTNDYVPWTVGKWNTPGNLKRAVGGSRGNVCFNVMWQLVSHIRQNWSKIQWPCLWCWSQYGCRLHSLCWVNSWRGLQGLVS